LKKILDDKAPAWRILLLLSLLIGFTIQAHAQTVAPEVNADKDNAKKSDQNKYKLYIEAGVETSDNVFRLTDSQKTKMETNDRGDIISGRFKDMESLSDIIIEPTIGLKLNSKSLFDGRLRLTSSVTYNYYTKNDKCSFPEGRLKLSNSIGKDGNLILEGKYLSGFFKRNYLSGVNDRNHNGNIPKDERIYSPAIYDEYEVITAYDHKLIKKKKKKISGLDIEPFIGFHNRTYNSIFSNRNQKITFGGMVATLELITRIDLEMIYQYESVVGPNRKELTLFDEVTDNIDANLDGERKRNAPLFTNIDRSAKRQTIGIKPSFNLSEDILLSLEYKRRISSYTSDNKLDIDHYHVDAIRQQICSGIIYNFSKAWSAEARYTRTDDEDDEDGNYSQNNFLVKIKYDIF
jgi:hypothetical protein